MKIFPWNTSIVSFIIKDHVYSKEKIAEYMINKHLNNNDNVKTINKKHQYIKPNIPKPNKKY